MQCRHLATLVRRVGFTEEQPSAQKTKASRYEAKFTILGHHVAIFVRIGPKILTIRG